MKTFLLLIPLLFVTFYLSGQNTTVGMRYQAVVRDADGSIIANEPMRARIELVTMDGRSQVYYEEIHDIRSNEFGLLNLTIGEGEVRKGTYADIPWAKENIWIRTSLKRQNSDRYDIITTNQLYSVPYAQYARTAGALESPTPDLDLRSLFPQISPFWSITGNKLARKINDPPTLGTLDENPIIIVTNNTERMTISETGSIHILGALMIDSNVMISQNLNINSNLEVDSNVTVGQHIAVAGNGEIAGELEVGSDVTLGQKLQVLGQAFIEDSLTVTGPVTFDIEVSGLQTEQISYPVLIKGSDQGLAIDLTPATEDCLTSHRGNNYISFWRDGEQKGRIEGMGRADLDPTGLLGMLIDILSDPAEVSDAFGGIIDIDLATPIEDFGSELLNIIEFSPGSLPTLEGGELPSLNGGSLPNVSFTPPEFDAGSFPSLDPGALPYLMGGMLPNISFNTPMFSNPFEDSELENTFEELFDNFNAVNTNDVGCIIENTSPAQTAWNVMRASLMDANLYPAQADATNFESQIFSNYTLDVLLGGISTLTSAVTFFSSLGSILDPEDIFSQGVDLLSNIYSLVIYGSYSDINIGVAYESGAGDYAEWLLRADPDELIQPGDVVGVIGGRISKNFVHADRFMAVSTSPLLLGNMPENAEEERLSEKIAFVGQVPVKVMGEVSIGDYILPSGSGDGIGIAVNPGDMLARDYQRIIGIAWEENQEDGYIQLINTAVGINHNDMAKTIEQMQFTLNHIQAQLKKLDPSFESHDYEVTVEQFGGSTLDYSVSPTHISQNRAYFEEKNYSSNSEMLSDVRERIVQNAGIDLAQVPLLDFAFKNPTQAKCLASEYQIILEDMIKVKNSLLQKSDK